ncbi:MAG: carbon monoxide dehydrogenase E protein, partial [uncultured Nocardioidaceae bacterium]
DRPPRRVHPGAAPGRPAGQPHRGPRRHGGDQAHPARGPRGVQVRAGGHAREERRPLEGVRDRVRGVLLDAGTGVRHRGRRRRRAREAARGHAGAGRRRPAGHGRRRRRGHGGAHARGARRDALPGDAQRRRGHDAGRRPPGRAPLRRHGARPAGGRHVLPLPDAAEPRPRRRGRAHDG